METVASEAPAGSAEPFARNKVDTHVVTDGALTLAAKGDNAVFTVTTNGMKQLYAQGIHPCIPAGTQDDQTQISAPCLS